MNCLNDGLPIGLFIKDKNKKYKVMGLAFVERYNSATGMFTLHGPVNAKTVKNSSFISAGFDELKPEIQNQLEQMMSELKNSENPCADKVRLSLEMTC